MSQQGQPPQGCYYTSRAGLCALGVTLQALDFFGPIERLVQIQQKNAGFRPTDKLKDIWIAMLSGVTGLYQSDKVVRADPAVQLAFGQAGCAQQAALQATPHACQPENVQQLRSAWNEIFRQYSSACRHDLAAQVLILDLDLSGERTSKHAELATKGYFAGHRNAYGRQHARILAAPYDEVVVERLYAGNTSLSSVLQDIIQEAEQTLGLSAEQRSQVAIRIDSAGGGEDRIDWLLERGYQVHIKMKSWQRAAKLAQSVAVWRPSPEHPNRQAGLVTRPYRFVGPTVQIAVRSAKTKGGWSYHVIVSSLAPETVVALSGQVPEAAWQAEAVILAYCDVYDDRGGPIEHSFGEDHQGLPLGRRHRRAFIAQEVTLLLLGLAHNTLVWTRDWLSQSCDEVQDFGILRLARDILQVPGLITFDETGRLVQIAFNSLDPLAPKLLTAWQSLLAPVDVVVTLAEPRIVNVPMV
jgi:hypothetical protein